VLPFTNLSNDPDQQYFADGITEDVTTDLSRISHMLVISRNTAFRRYFRWPSSGKTAIGRGPVATTHNHAHPPTA